MVFPSVLPPALRETLNKLHYQGNLSDFLQQFSELLREGLGAAGISIILHRGETTVGAASGRLGTKKEEIEKLTAERCSPALQTVPLSALSIFGDGFFIPVGNNFLATDEPLNSFLGGIVAFQPTANVVALQNPLLLPLVLSQVMERVLFLSESFPIGTFAHDLKHYLLLSEAACERLSDTTPDAEPVQSIRAALQRMQLLTSTLLLMERDRAKTLRFQPIRISVGEIVREVVNCFQPIAYRAGITLQCTSMEGSYEAAVDPTLFPSIITNLLDNALKYCPRSSTVTVSVSTAASELTLTVADNGPGIPQSDVPAVFLRGFRGSSSTAASGHGFGLAIVKRLVELHGGSIELHETHGGGCTFVVRIKHSLK